MADGYTAGAEFTVNVTTNDVQRDPEVAALAGGGWVVVWESVGQDGSEGGVFGQRLDASGAKVGAEFQVNTAGAGNQVNASVEALAGGGFVVSWFSSQPNGNVQVFDAAGAKVGGAIALAGGGSPDVAALGDGGFLVARLLGDDTVVQKYDATGHASGAAFTANTTLAGYQRLVALSGTPDGGAIAVWGQDSGAPETGTFIQLFNASGAKVGGEVKIATGYPGSDVEVTGLAGGGFVVAETFFTYAFNSRVPNTGIKLIRLDAQGHAVGELDVKAPTSSSENFSQPEVRGSADGGFVVAWTSGGSVSTQHFDANWNRVGDEVVAASGSHADVAARPNGDFLVVAGGADVHARLFVAAAAQPQNGGPGDDLITGDDGDNRLSGGDGADRIFGGLGNDTLDGGAGSDYLRGGAGADVIDGGDGFDDVHGNEGDDTVHGGLGDDWVVGGKDNDQLWGDAGSDIVYGNLGADTCDGGAGADLIRGGQGDDMLYGGAGNDWLSGDRGNDTLTGGAGADIFHTSSQAGLDRVTDFNFAEGDRVMLDPGTAYTVTQVGADTVIDMGGGDQMVLAGVQMSCLGSGWIFGA